MQKYVVLLALCVGLVCSVSNPSWAKAQSRTAAHNTPDPTLELQVGQMLFVGFAGTHAGDVGVERARILAESGHIGGLIVHTYNVVSPTQLKALVQAIRSWQTPYPLLVCVDQEGGLVQRLRAERGFTDYPTAWVVGHDTPEAAEAVYGQLAAELAGLGFDMNFGPVVDLHNAQSAAIGARGRSFAETPEEVVRSAGIFIRAHRRASVITAVKHFVGHGAALGDTHKGFADITENYDDAALMPYAALIDDDLVDMVMTAHLTNRHIEPYGQPMTFSARAIEGLLRQQLHFDGVIISDDLQMGALTQNYSLQQILRGTIVSGHDILLFSQNAAADGHSAPAFRAIPELFEKTLAVVREAIAAKSLTPDQLHQHFLRIVALKQRRASAAAE